MFPARIEKGFWANVYISVHRERMNKGLHNKPVLHLYNFQNSIKSLQIPIYVKYDLTFRH